MKTLTLLLASTACVALAAFENKSKWKMDGDNLALDTGGNPIYLKDDGSEQSVDGQTIMRLNNEARTNRERAETAEALVKTFEGVNPVEAKKAIETLAKIDQKKLMDAGEVDKVRDEVSKQFTTQLDEYKTTNASQQDKIDAMIKERAFDRSEFVRDRIAVPPEMFYGTFGANFKVEDGKVIPYDKAGNKIYSKKRMSEIADVDEAFELMVADYPHKETILKAVGAGGSGSSGAGGNRGGSRNMTRAAFDALTPVDKATAAASVRKGELVVSD